MGNHAQALALAALLRGIPAHIVMPESSPMVKVAAVRDYGARIVFCPPTQKDREQTLERVVAETEAAFIHPYNNLRIIAGEPKGADDAFRSIRDGRIYPSENPKTIADGLLTSLGSLTFPIIRRYVEKIVTVEEESIVAAMRHIWERMKILIEPSAAVPFAALLEGNLQVRDMRIGIILSGGNLDLDALPWLKS